MVYIETKTLNNGIEIPVVGLGVYNSGSETENAVRTALEVGYKHIDTAAFYGNEVDVARGIKQSGLERKDVFITTKLWNDDMRAHMQCESIEKSLEHLKTDYIDLYLIHWPVKDVFVESWKIMEEYYKKGVFKAIGVSNFHTQHMEELLKSAEILPAVNQIEVHPYLTQESLVKYCQEKGIAVECWSPVARGKIFNDEILINIAKKYNKTVSQIVLRWEVQRGLIVIPKSVHRERIIENAEIFDFSLSDEDMNAIFALNRDERVNEASNPDNFTF